MYTPKYHFIFTGFFSGLDFFEIFYPWALTLRSIEV